MAKIITEKIFKYEIPDGKRKERIDLFLTNNVEHATRSRIQKHIKDGNVTVNDKVVKANYQVVPADFVKLTIPCSPRPEIAEPEDIPLDIVYEDAHLILVNKPAGMVVHPSFGNYEGTLVNALLHHSKKLSDVNTAERPGIVHRIDKDTSGILIIAKDDWTHAQLAHQFQAHSIEREYWTVVWGKMKESSGTIRSMITRSKKDRKKFTMHESEGKEAITHYEVLEEFEFASLLRVTLETGRTHQIRVHMSGTGHPVFGDVMYDGRAIHYGSQLPKMKSRIDNLLTIMQRQALHAKTLGFYHPHKKEMLTFDSALPEDFSMLLSKIKVNDWET